MSKLNCNIQLLLLFRCFMPQLIVIFIIICNGSYSFSTPMQNSISFSSFKSNCFSTSFNTFSNQNSISSLSKAPYNQDFDNSSAFIQRQINLYPTKFIKSEIHSTIKLDTNIISVNGLPSQNVLKISQNTEQFYFGMSLIKDAHNSGNRAVNLKKQQRWIDKTSKYLAEKKHKLNFPILELSDLEHEDFYLLRTRLIKKGKMEFADGGFLFFMSHSNHENPAIGDLTIAMDEKNNFYINEGHICGDIIHFVTHKKMNDLLSSDFISQFFSDTDQKKWKELGLSTKN
jgi:hypothetical protein